MRSTMELALFLRAFFSEMNRPVLAERPRSVNRGVLVAMTSWFPDGGRVERLPAIGTFSARHVD